MLYTYENSAERPLIELPNKEYILKKYDFIVYIGRFQPFHAGHYHVVQEALQRAEKVILLLGSSNLASSTKNPFSFDDRKTIISSALTADEQSRVLIAPINDYLYNEPKWRAGVQTAVYDATSKFWLGKEFDIALIGHDKDETSYYIKTFPQWDLIELEITDPINATDIRNVIYGNLSHVIKESWFVNKTHMLQTYSLARFNSGNYFRLINEFEVIQKYKEPYKSLPYPPIFVTVDTIITQSGHVLLVKRKSAPGEGLWALPGGYLNHKEYLIDAALRELKEETKIGIRHEKLRGNIVETHVFDAPDRDPRGRLITHAFLINLPDSKDGLPKIQGSDDAAYAEWMPIAKISGIQNQLYADHGSILDYFGLLK